MNHKVAAFTSFLNSATALAKAPHPDEGAVVNSTKSITRLTVLPEDPEVWDPDLRASAQELVAALTFRASTTETKREIRSTADWSKTKMIDVIDAFTVLADSGHGDEGPLDGVRSSITGLQEEDPAFLDPVFVDASNELAAAIVTRVSVASVATAASGHPSLASASGSIAYRQASTPDPVTGSSPVDAAGDALPENNPTVKRPQRTNPGVGNAGTGAQPGDMTMGSGL